MNRLYLVRHGHTDYNAEGRYVGELNVGLNPVGVRQAHDLAEDLKKENVDIIITSPQRRCTATADIFAEYVEAPVKAVDSLKERALGVYEGLTKEEVEKHFPHLWEQNITRHWDLSPPGGETISSVIHRVFPTIEKLIIDHDNQDVLMVCDGFVTKVVNHYFNDQQPLKEFHDFSLGNLDYQVYEVSS